MKGIKKLCSTLKRAASDHYFLVGCDGEEVWIEEEFVGYGGYIPDLPDEYQWEYIYRPLTMAEIKDLFTGEKL